MIWPDAEAAIRSHIETQWALSTYAAIMPLIWENDIPSDHEPDQFIAVSIEGTYAEKTIFGSIGMRSSVEGGIAYFHAFVPVSTGKTTAVGAVYAMTAILELQTIQTDIRLEGGNPPSPAEPTGRRDREIPISQPGGMYFRCSGSVPFIVTGTV